jgi:hypothetical protein
MRMLASSKWKISMYQGVKKYCDENFLSTFPGEWKGYQEAYQNKKDWIGQAKLKKESKRCRTFFRAWSAVTISTNAQYVTRPKCFSHPTLGCNFFPTLPIKLKLGLKVAGTLHIASHLDPIRNREKSINTIWLCLLRYSRALRAVGFFRVSCGFTGFDSWTSSKISNAGSQTEPWWRCLEEVRHPHP